MFDSGASLAMSSDMPMFTNYQTCTEPDFVSTADDTPLRIKGYGGLSVILDGTHEMYDLRGLAHFPEAEYELISIAK